MGPAYLLDVVGIDTAHHAQAVMAQGFPERMGKQGRDAIDALFEADKYGRRMAMASTATPLIEKVSLRKPSLKKSCRYSLTFVPINRTLTNRPSFNV